MKFGELLSAFLFIWIIVSYIVVGIMDAAKSLSFGFSNPSFGSLGQYALFTVDNVLYALGLLVIILGLTYVPTYKLKIVFIVFVFLTVGVYLIYSGVIL